MSAAILAGIAAAAWLADRIDARHIADRKAARTAETARRRDIAKAVAVGADGHRELQP